MSDDTNKNSLPSGSSDNAWRLYLAGGLIFIGFVAAGVWGFGDLKLLVVNEHLVESGGDIFLKYLFLALAIERAAAVFVSNYRNRKAVDWSLRISRIKETLDNAEQPVDVLSMVYGREIRVARGVLDSQMLDLLPKVKDGASAEEYRAVLLCLKHSYEFAKARHQSLCNRDITFFVFISGIVLAFLGLSILGDVLADIQGLNNTQEIFLRFADVLITGGLLGGGSSGLNFASTRFAELMKKG
ncbi:hypothetical protein ACFSJ3_03910 [Corallincola platygyrae]|uniref:MotA/TolQ/ExbB proton channel domain-containing protein n=1 Tax=Corallincola platygyrae TaxID=1193278 RepID=A0ABW4XJF9_9GAMM